MNSLSSRENTVLAGVWQAAVVRHCHFPVSSWPGNTIPLLQLSCIPEMTQEIAKCELAKLNSE